MTAATLTRPQRAMQLCMRTQKQWTPARIGIKMPSQSRPGVVHTVTTEGCTCEDRQYRLVACSHMIAARIFMGRSA